MNRNQIRSILCIAKNKSIAKAADELFLSRQALIKQLNVLEEEVGFRIFERNTSGCVCTEEGKLFVSEIRKIDSQLNRLVEKCQNMSGLIIRVPYGVSDLLNEIVNEFTLKYPNVQIKYVNEYGENRFEAVNQGVVDILCTFWYEEESEEVDYYPLEQLNYVCLVAKSHPFAQREFITLDDLKNENVAAGKHDYQSMKNELIECKSIETIEVTRLQIFNACYAGKVLVTHHGFFDKTLVEIPIKPDISKTFGFLVGKKKTKVVQNFCDVAKGYTV